MKKLDTNGTSVPEFSFAGTGVYDALSKQLLVFEADVTLLRRQGGISRIDPRTGTADLVIPVSTTLLGNFDRVEAMALDKDNRLVFLARREAVRGPSAVSVAVLDLRRNHITLVGEHGKGHACGDPQVVRGSGGDVGFSYRDDTVGERVLVHYRVTP